MLIDKLKQKYTDKTFVWAKESLTCNSVYREDDYWSVGYAISLEGNLYKIWQVNGSFAIYGSSEITDVCLDSAYAVLFTKEQLEHLLEEFGYNTQWLGEL